MAIVSSAVLENTPLASGYRIKLAYTFDDNSTKEINCRGSNVNDAATFLISKAQSVLDSKKSNDLDTLIQSDSDIPVNDLTQVEIYKAWMFKGFNSNDPIKSYRYLSKVAQKVIALGLSLQDLATAMNEPLETIQLVLAKWQYIKANKDAIAAYKIIKDGM